VNLNIWTVAMFVIANTLRQQLRALIRDVLPCKFHISKCFVPYRRQIQTEIKYSTIQYKFGEVVVLYHPHKNYLHRSLIFVKDLQQTKNSGFRN
jgi:hypothetical protein